MHRFMSGLMGGWMDEVNDLMDMEIPNAKSRYTEMLLWELKQLSILMDTWLSNLSTFPQALQSEGLVMEEELCRLRSQAELHRMQTTVIATLEGERAALERDRDALRNTMDALRTAQRKVEEYTCTNTCTQTHMYDVDVQLRHQAFS